MPIGKLQDIRKGTAGSWVYFLEHDIGSFGFIGQWESKKTFLVKTTSDNAILVSESGPAYSLTDTIVEPKIESMIASQSPKPGALCSTETGTFLCFKLTNGGIYFLNIETGEVNYNIDNIAVYKLYFLEWSLFQQRPNETSEIFTYKS
jgi:hypothetical protein